MGSGEFYWGWAEEARRALLDTRGEAMAQAAPRAAQDRSEQAARGRPPEVERAPGRDPE